MNAPLALRQNRLLAALDPSDFALLAPHLKGLPLLQGAILQEAETPVQHVCFPLSGMVSLVTIMDSGDVIETATVGREGAVGAFAGLGPWHAFNRAVVQLPGSAACIAAARFHAAVKQSEAIRNWFSSSRKRCWRRSSKPPRATPCMGWRRGSPDGCCRHSTASTTRRCR